MNFVNIKVKIINLARIFVVPLLSSCNQSNIRYEEYLPSTATEVRIKRESIGIDYAIFMKAKIGTNDFNIFLKRLDLKRPSESESGYTPTDPKISAWWDTTQEQEVFIKHIYSDHGLASVSDLLWATYEEGYLYFSHSNF